MGESLNSVKLPDSEIDKYGKYSTDEIAKIIYASLLYDSGKCLGRQIIYKQGPVERAVHYITDEMY